MEEITTIAYKAFDDSVFKTKTECKEYEARKRAENIVNLRNFEITFPMQDNFYTCRAYWIRSENEFKMLSDYIFDLFSEASDCCGYYQGNGWYVVQNDDCEWAYIVKLSEIIKDWTDVLNKIMAYTMDFKEV